MNLNLLMQNGIANIIKKAGRYYLTNRKGLAFLTNTLPRLKQSAMLRQQNEEDGAHIPPFLIASIASQCNLHCSGCYARAGGACCENKTAPDLSADRWADIFTEAAALGISFCLLAGGEPLLRRDVLEHAAQTSDIIFPIFTNGTVIDEAYMQMFDNYRHLIPVFSIEGNATDTDQRRGTGVSAAIEHTMTAMMKRRILFGASITVTRDNLNTVVSHKFITELRRKKCGIVFFIEYVPAEKGTEALALKSKDLELLKQRADILKDQFDDMVILSFPGDEEAMGGCLASGRGFFHINPHGGAEPCPFSPYSQYNLKDTSIKEVLNSGYFQELQQIAAAAGAHTGGCVLFEREQEVQALLTK